MGQVPDLPLHPCRHAPLPEFRQHKNRKNRGGFLNSPKARFGPEKASSSSATAIPTNFRNSPPASVRSYAEIPGGPNGNAFDEQGRLYTCEFRDRRVTRLNKNGKIDVLASRFEGKRLNAPNDIVVRRDGTVFFTDPAFGNQQDSRELDFYGVFRITPKGELGAIARWKTRPDGIALSPNGTTALRLRSRRPRCPRLRSGR